MPRHINPIPRPIFPGYHEASEQRSPRDSDSLARQWKKNGDLMVQIRWLTESIKQLQWQLNRLRLRKGGGEGAAVGGNIIQCKVTELHGTDYWTVQKWNNDDYVGDEFVVAKSIPARMVGTATLEEVEYTYTYDGDNARSSFDGLTSEAQRLFPPIAEGDIVYVRKVDFTGVNDANEDDIKYIEVNTAREWVKHYEAE